MQFAIRAYWGLLDIETPNWDLFFRFDPKQHPTKFYKDVGTYDWKYWGLGCHFIFSKARPRPGRTEEPANVA